MTDGWTDKRMDRESDEQTNMCIEKQSEEQTYRRLDRHKMNEQEWMDGQRDRQIDRQTD